MQCFGVLQIVKDETPPGLTQQDFVWLALFDASVVVDQSVKTENISLPLHDLTAGFTICLYFQWAFFCMGPPGGGCGPYSFVDIFDTS